MRWQNPPVFEEIGYSFEKLEVHYSIQMASGSIKIILCEMQMLFFFGLNLLILLANIPSLSQVHGSTLLCLTNKERYQSMVVGMILFKLLKSTLEYAYTYTKGNDQSDCDLSIIFASIISGMASLIICPWFKGKQYNLSFIGCWSTISIFILPVWVTTS